MTEAELTHVLSVLHDTRSPRFRKPFGAVSTETTVELSIALPSGCKDVCLCYAYGLYSLSYHEMLLERDESDSEFYRTSVCMPSEAGLFFYWFRFACPSQHLHANSDASYDGHFEHLYYVQSSSNFSGSGKVSRVPSRVGADEERYPGAFQITVYDASFKTPDWMKGALIYQIFPDRFYRGKAFDFDAVSSKYAAKGRLFHSSWQEDVDIDGTPETGYIACDFYGGTLKGIAEKIDYIKALNIDLLYLNPIFEARSNHRYDTADYKAVDPVLGGEQAFDDMADALKKEGIRFILDGVFSHTGADSLYFNKYGNYPGIGAYESYKTGKNSPYRSWYSFYREHDGQIAYDSWWGFTELPNVQEMDLSYIEFILGKDGVLAHWIKKGASGFRLDVSDELPDAFIRHIRKSVHAASGEDGIVLGEVWEDASNKVSYGNYRDFLFGHTHDSVMGYTFTHALLGYLSHAYVAEEADHLLESIRENYPPQAHYCIMNLISSHDIPRAITALCGQKDPGDRQSQKQLYLSQDQKEEGYNLMKMAFAFQIGYVGSPSVYYGDEVGMEGYRDPFNRRTYPWDALTDEQKDLLAFYRSASVLRKIWPVLKTGAYRTLLAQDDLWAFERYLDEEGKDFFGQTQQGPRHVLFIFNRHRSEEKQIAVPDALREKWSASKALCNEQNDLPSQTQCGHCLVNQKDIVIKPVSFGIIASTC